MPQSLARTSYKHHGIAYQHPFTGVVRVFATRAEAQSLHRTSESSGQQLLSHCKPPAVTCCKRNSPVFRCWEQRGWGFSFYFLLTSRSQNYGKVPWAKKVNGYYFLWGWLISLFEFQRGFLRQPFSPRPSAPREHLLCSQPSSSSVNQPSVTCLGMGDSAWMNLFKITEGLRVKPFVYINLSKQICRIEFNSFLKTWRHPYRQRNGTAAAIDLCPWGMSAMLSRLFSFIAFKIISPLDARMFSCHFFLLSRSVIV